MFKKLREQWKDGKIAGAGKYVAGAVEAPAPTAALIPSIDSDSRRDSVQYTRLFLNLVGILAPTPLEAYGADCWLRSTFLALTPERLPKIV